VTAADTGQPLAQVTSRVSASREAQSGTQTGEVETQTDPQGRFRLVPSPGPYLTLHASPPAGTPYLPLRQEIERPKAAVMQELQLSLRRGLLLRGQVTEQGTGRPVAGALVQIYPRVTPDT